MYSEGSLQCGAMIINNTILRLCSALQWQAKVLYQVNHTQQQQNTASTSMPFQHWCKNAPSITDLSSKVLKK